MEINKVMDEVLGDTPNLTASDLYSADFSRALRGFKPEEVAAFLERAADSFEALQRQVKELKATVAEQEDQLASYQALEQSLADALATAQRLNETTIEQAKREAELIRREAQLVLEAARKNARAIPETLRDEIQHLKAMRKRLKADMRAVLDIHAALLRGDNDAKWEMLDFLPADGAAYLVADESGQHRHGDDADVAIIEDDSHASGGKDEA